MEPHYCRARSKKEYLECGLNTNIMYTMYKKKCIAGGKDCVKMHHYAHVVNICYNLDIFLTKTINIVFFRIGLYTKNFWRKISDSGRIWKAYIRKKLPVEKGKTQTFRNVMLVMKKVGCMHLIYKTPCSTVSALYTSELRYRNYINWISHLKNGSIPFFSKIQFLYFTICC